jgi:hypothetical protein
MNSAFIIEPNAKVTYINQIHNTMWPNWKIYKDCTEEEKEQINLSSYPSNSILFDRDLPGKTEAEINEDYSGFKEMLIKRKINCFYSYRSPKGFHILALFKNLEKLDPDLRKEIKKYYVSLFQTDPAKISDRGIVSLPGKPHFKNDVIYNVFEWVKGENDIHESVLQDCKQKVEENRNKLIKINKDTDFVNYCEKDPFFLYIKNNEIPEGTGRDITIFPNLAIAMSKSGKTMEEIKEIIQPIIKKNFPGKKYVEFEGWLKKALSNEIADYNPFQLNSWMRIYSKDKKDVYNMNPDKIELLEDEKKEKFKVYWDKDLDDITDTKNEWLIEGWLSKSDINFIAGKAASFKSTVALHIAFAVSEGLPVFN